MEKSIAVIDLKAFYSYVECIDRGLDPWTTPLVVADKERGKNTIVLSVTPYLKSKGIPSRLRIKELPKGYDYIYAVPRMERYLERSSEVITIMTRFVSSEDIHVYSIDEAFIDLTTYLNYYKMTAKELTSFIINEIKRKTGLQATGGIGDNFFLAKIALDIYAKKEPDGIAIVRSEDVPNKLWTITNLTDVWGIGQGMLNRLNNLGIFNMYDLAHSSKSFLINKLGVMGEQLYNCANGIDESDIREQYVPKERSLTIGQVLFKDYTKQEAVIILREMVDDLSLRMRNQNKQCSLVSLFIGYSKNMGGFARQMSLLKSTDNSKELLDAVLEIYNRNIKDLPIRNISINFGKLSTLKYQQLSLFENPISEMTEHDFQSVVDYAHNKYGMDSLLRLSALLENSTAIERHNQIGGHRK